MYTLGSLYTPPRRGVRGGLVRLVRVRGGLSPLVGGSGGSGLSAGVLEATPLQLKTDVKLPCKNILISSQSRLFIRQMI